MDEWLERLRYCQLVDRPWCLALLSLHLSYRDMQDLLFERDVAVSHEAIHKWCRKFGEDYTNRLRRRRPQPKDTWHVDEVFLTIYGEVMTCGGQWIRTITSLTSFADTSARASHAGGEVSGPCPALSRCIWPDHPTLSTTAASVVCGSAYRKEMRQRFKSWAEGRGTEWAA